MRDREHILIWTGTNTAKRTKWHSVKWCCSIFKRLCGFSVEQDTESKNASLTCRCHWQDGVIEEVWVYSKEVMWIHNKAFGHAEVAKLSIYCHQNRPREFQSAGIGPKVRKSAETGRFDCICLCQYHSICTSDALTSLYICFVKHLFSQGSQGFKAKNISNMDMSRHVAPLNSIQETPWSSRLFLADCVLCSITYVYF